MTKRTRNLVVRTNDREHDMLRALVDAADLPAAYLIRGWIKDHYAAKFGDVEPTSQKSKR